MAELQQIVIDCRHPASLARFWAAVLDGYDVRAYDDREINRLASLGLTPESDPCVLVDGPGPELCFQLTDAEPATTRPLHLDMSAADRGAEVERLVALGAQVRAEFSTHTWMIDPERNNFCVTD